jgi:hypothetical protein
MPIDDDAVTLREGVDTAVTDLEPYYWVTLESILLYGFYPYLFRFSMGLCHHNT